MKLVAATILITFMSSRVSAGTLLFAQGKGQCPRFTLDGDPGWKAKPDRKAGDRWILQDEKGESVVRFDFRLGNTDQKQLPEVELKEMKLGDYTVEKYTVTTSLSDPATIATDGLITSYEIKNGKLRGLVIMLTDYDLNSKRDKKIEAKIATIELVE